MEKNERVDVFENILRETGSELRKGSTILDVGCGNGDTVKELLSRGYSAYGCDLTSPKTLIIALDSATSPRGVEVP